MQYICKRKICIRNILYITEIRIPLHAWKACNRQKRFGGSNPPLSANMLKNKGIVASIVIERQRYY